MRKALLARSGLVVAAVANLILAAMCVIGSGGQTQIVTFDVRGDSFQARVDGYQIIPDPAATTDPYASLELPDSGTISLGLGPPIPGLPDPQGIDSLVVKDGAGVVLFRDDFDSLDLDRWQIADGSFEIEDGVLVARNHATANNLKLRGTGWRDYTLEVRFRNGGTTNLGVRESGNGGLFFHFPLVRDFVPFAWALEEDGGFSGNTLGRVVTTGKRGSVTSLLAMVAGSYPLPLLALAAGGLVAAMLALLEHLGTKALPGLAQQVQDRVVRPFIRKAAWPAVVLALAVFVAGVAAHIMSNYYDRVPHLPDEASYIFQARLFAAGQLSAAIPNVEEAFHIWAPINWVFEHDGHWSSVYPAGHPLILALGIPLDAIWLVPPLVGGACVVLMALIGRKLFGPVTGLLAALLLAASPFFLIQSGNFMSHITWVFYLLMAVFFLLQRQRTLLFGALAGLFYGLLVNTRALEAIIILPLFAIALTWPLLRQETRAEAAGRCVGLLAGGSFAAVLMLLYNAVLAGDPLTLPYHGSSGVSQNLGFANGHTLSIGLRNMQALLMALILLFNGWPTFVGLTLVLLPFLLGTRNVWDYFCAACALLLTGVYLLYRHAAGDGGLYEGPRYWFQAMPFLMLLSARGVVLAAGVIGDAAGRLRVWLTGDVRPARWAGAAVLTPVLLFLIADGTGGWLFNWNKDWLEINVPQVQNNISAMHNIYGVDNRLLKLEAEMNLKNALIFVPGCGFEGTNPACYDTVFNENSLDFNGNVVWALNIPELNERVIEAYPGRDVYVATWEPPSIVRYEPEPPLGAETP